MIKAGETINRIQEATQTRIQFVPDDPKLTDRGCYIIGPQEGFNLIHNFKGFLSLILGCLKAREEVLEIVKKKMEEVNAQSTPMPKVKSTFSNFF